MSATSLMTSTFVRVRKMKTLALPAALRRSHIHSTIRPATTCIPRKRSIELARSILPNDRCVRARASKNKLLLCTSSAPVACSSTRAAKPSTSLPRRLPRPIFSEVSQEKLASIDSDLANVPAQYVRDKLQLFGAQMLASVALTSTTIALTSDGTLPREVPISVDSKAVEPPTHLFAIPSPCQTRKSVTIYPVHASIITSHCTRLPTLPSSSSTASSSSFLPIIPLRLPHPSSFPMLQAYLYTKRSDILLASLLNSKSRLATITGLWRNVCALGVADDGLWSALDIAWGNAVGSSAST